MPLYQRISKISEGIKQNLINFPEFKKEILLQNQNVMLGKGSLFKKEPLGVECDFVIFKKPDFKWYNQKHKDEVILAAKILFKTSVDNLKMDIEKELFKFHSIQSLRKLFIVVNNFDDIKKEYIVANFIKNYELMLTFPPFLSDNIKLEKCPLCGTSPSRIEPWFYHEETDELLPVAEYIEEATYFSF